MNLDVVNGSVPKLRFVRNYKHVGTDLAIETHLGNEISMRCGAMFSGSHRLRKCILRNASIEVNKRLFVLQTYLLTKGTYQCCTWSDLSAHLQG